MQGGCNGINRLDHALGWVGFGNAVPACSDCNQVTFLAADCHWQSDLNLIRWARPGSGCTVTLNTASPRLLTGLLAGRVSSSGRARRKAERGKRRDSVLAL